MNASNKDHAVLHADAAWMQNILERMQEILKKDDLDEFDIDSLRWLVKQALKCKKEE